MPLKFWKILTFLFFLTWLTFAELDQANNNYGVVCAGAESQAVGSSTGIYLKNPGIIGAASEANIQTGEAYKQTSNFYAAAFNLVFDTSAPLANSILILSGAQDTNTRNVYLDLSASDDGILNKMMISNDQITWVTVNYSPTYTGWQLSSGDGLKTVYVKFTDLMNNTSSIISDTINLDTSGPNQPSGINFSVSGGSLGSKTNILSKSAGTVDPGDTLEWRYRINNSEWTAYGTETIVSGLNADGQTEYAIQARSVDDAGNYTESEIVTKSSIDRTMLGLPGLAAALPWSTNPDPALIDFADCTDPETDQNNYKIYWGKDVNSTEANAGNGLVSEYDPPAISDGVGTYYLRAAAADTVGNYGPWRTVAVYHYYAEGTAKDYYFVDSSGASENIPDNATAALVRIDVNNNNEEIAHVTINAEELGLNINQDDFSRIILDKDSNGSPFIMVPEDSALAVTVNAAKQNGTPIWVPISFGKFTSPPIIYVATSNGGIAITGYNGATINNQESDRIRNYYFNPATGYVYFEVNEFSQYGAVAITNLVFDNFVYYGDPGSTASVRVRITDLNNEGVAEAPVTFSIQSGDGTLLGDTAVTTNAEGYASIVFEFPVGHGNTTIKAETTANVSNTAIMTVLNGLTPQEQAAYDAWAAQYSPDIGGPSNDPDADGIANLYEWNYGKAPTTNPTIVDTDGDGFSDKWDAYPANNSLRFFDNDYNVTQVTGKLFTGTAKGQQIYILGSNMYAQYNNLIDTSYISKNITVTVAKISGLEHENIKDGNLGEAFSNNLYKGLEPGREYSVELNYINRGNDTDSYSADITLEQTDARWLKAEYVNNLSNVSRWQQTGFEVKVMPNQANNFEKVTLNISIELIGATAKKYEAHPGAWLGGTFNNDGWYGGQQRFPESGSNVFVLEAQSYNVKFIKKTALINVPEEVQESNQGKLIPGSQILFSVVLKNESSAVATSVNIKDVVPQNCHLYYTDTPAVEGAVSWQWKGATDNTADENTVDAVFFEVTMPSKGTVTVNYTVTVD